MNDETQYQKGFNEGYLIAKHLPELSAKLAKITNETSRIEGFHDGRKQHLLEQSREYRPAWLKGERHKGQDKPKDKDREPDK